MSLRDLWSETLHLNNLTYFCIWVYRLLRDTPSTMPKRNNVTFQETTLTVGFWSFALSSCVKIRREKKHLDKHPKHEKSHKESSNSVPSSVLSVYLFFPKKQTYKRGISRCCLATINKITSLNNTSQDTMKWNLSLKHFFWARFCISFVSQQYMFP